MSTPFRSKKKATNANNATNGGIELGDVSRIPSGALPSSSIRPPTAPNAFIAASRASAIVNDHRRADVAAAEEARRVAAAEEAAAEETRRVAEETAHKREYAAVVDMAIAIYNVTNSDIKPSVILRNVHALINRASNTVGMKKFDWTKYADICFKQSILFRVTESKYVIVRGLLDQEEYDRNNNEGAIKKYEDEVKTLRINMNNARKSATTKQSDQQRIDLITERLIKLRDSNMMIDQRRIKYRIPALRQIGRELSNEAATATDFLRIIIRIIIDNAPPTMEGYAKRSLSSIVNGREGGGNRSRKVRTRRGKRGGRGTRRGV